MPPRHGKTEMVTVRYAAWRLECNPGLHIIVGAYNQTLAEKFSRKARKIAASRMELSRERAAVEDWETTAGGNYRAVGVGAGITGMGGDLIIVDDPVKGREEASSQAYRERAWEWYKDDIYTRLEPGGAIILIQCMMGDTSVLMADSTERPLRDIRVGDQVATYDNGELGISTVRNHTSNGADSVLRITTMCGKVVHANERHPFLVEEHGQLKWVRLKNLTTAHKIVTVKDSGASGKARPVPSMAAENLLAVGDIARHTTARRCGLMGIAPHRLMQNPGGMLASNIGTELPARSMMQCLQRKTANALSANSLQEIMCARIGPESCALITAMTPTQSEGFCATTAISPWDTPSRKQSHLPLPNTSGFTTEAIASIEPAGVEEVFDIQVDRTDNFIANGLVSHNTRWHEDDLAGRILSGGDAGRWTVLSLPAEAEINDPLGRKPGEALCPARYDKEALQNIRAVLGSRSYQSLFQQSPKMDEGNILKREWFIVTEPSIIAKRYEALVRYWDKAGTADGGSYTAGVLMGRTNGIYDVLDVMRGQWSTFEREDKMRETAVRDREVWGDVAIWIEQEPGSGGKDSALATIRNLAGYNIRAERPTGNKTVRAEPFAAQAEAGNIKVLKGAWNWAYLDEMAAFDSGVNDDQVDASSGAFNKLSNTDKVRYIPNVLDMAMEKIETKAVSVHADTEIHKHWAQRHFCQKCYDEYHNED